MTREQDWLIIKTSTKSLPGIQHKGSAAGSVSVSVNGSVGKVPKLRAPLPDLEILQDRNSINYRPLLPH